MEKIRIYDPTSFDYNTEQQSGTTNEDQHDQNSPQPSSYFAPINQMGDDEYLVSGVTPANSSFQPDNPYLPPGADQSSNFQSVYMGSSITYNDNQQLSSNDPNLPMQLSEVTPSIDQQLILDAQYMCRSTTDLQNNITAPQPLMSSSVMSSSVAGNEDGAHFNYEQDVERLFDDPTSDSYWEGASPSSSAANNTMINSGGEMVLSTNDTVNISTTDETITFNQQYNIYSDSVDRKQTSLSDRSTIVAPNSSTPYHLSSIPTSRSDHNVAFNGENTQRVSNSFTVSSAVPVAGIAGSASFDAVSNLSEDSRNRVISLGDQTTVMESTLVNKPCEVKPHELENEDIASMWVWSQPVAQSIAKLLAHPATTIIDRDQFTMPGVKESSPADPVQDLLSKYTKVNINRHINSSTITQDEVGLQHLMANENYRAALDLTERILTSLNQGRGMAGHISKNSVKSIRIWHVRFILLTKLKMYSSAESELEYFGNLERVDLSYQYYPHLYANRQGSMVPFSFRLLWAQIPAYSQKYNISLDRLSFLSSSVAKLIKLLKSGHDHNGKKIEDQHFLTMALKYWTDKENKILYSIGNCFILWMDYSSAFEVFDELYRKIEDKEEKIHLLTGIGRSNLQLGDLKKAAVSFKTVESLVNELRNSSNSDVDNNHKQQATFTKLDHQVLMNKGLLLLCQNKYKDAVTQFEQITKENPNDVVALNNLAVTYVYLGKMKDATTTLDDIMKHNPNNRDTNESLIQNLCILFGNETPKSLGKKILLLEHVAKYKGDSFSTSCLRLN